jgi:enediyne biosynthesis protein E4
MLAVLGSIAAGLAGAAPHPLFRDVAEETGLRFRHFTGSSGEYFMPEIMGGGGALLDYDGDGDLDVLLVQGAMVDERKTPAEARFPPAPGQPPGTRLFRNDLERGSRGTGRLRFTDVTEKAGLRVLGHGMGVAVGDYDNDGHPDIYLTAFGPNALYHNNGNGTFTDVTPVAGVDDPRWSTSATFFDYDEDGDLDLFVANYLDFTVAGNKTCFDAVGARDFCSPARYRPVPGRLFRNEGGGRFADVTEASGIAKAFGPGLGAVAADFDRDGRLDLYVANDGTANQLWLNRGNRKFEEQGLLSGTAYNAEGLPQGSMGVAAGDVDADGDEDLLVTNLPREGSTFYLNQGEGRFQDMTDAWGLRAPSLPFTGFGTGWLDYDNDGRLDLFVGNGAVNIVDAQRGQPYPFQQPKQLFHNEGRPPLREVAPEVAGPAVGLAEVSRAAAFGDVDEDGGIDVLVTNNNGPVRLLLNQAPRGHWLQARLRGVQDNADGLGAWVGLVRTSGPTLWRRAHTDGSYLAVSDPRVHFGLGGSTRYESLLVRWPSGRRERWTGLGADRTVTLRQGTGKPWPAGIP